MTNQLILVVEDNEKNMKLFRDVLVAGGYRTLEATTGEEAVELADEHVPDLVLMDIQLPDIDGRGGARTAPCERTDVGCPGARPHGAGDGRRPRAVPRGGVR